MPVELLLVKNGKTQGYKPKNKLLAAGLKAPKCEICGFSAQTVIACSLLTGGGTKK